MPGRPRRSLAWPGSSTSTVFMCGSRRTIFAPGKSLSAAASSSFEWKPTTARIVSGRLVEPLGARIAPADSAATTRRGNLRSRTGIKAAWGAGKGSCPSSAGPGGCGTLVRGMASPDRVTQRDHARVRVALDGTGESNVSSGLPVLDHLLGLLARYGALDLELQTGAGGSGGRGRIRGQGARPGAPRAAHGRRRSGTRIRGCGSGRCAGAHRPRGLGPPARRVERRPVRGARRRARHRPRRELPPRARRGRRPYAARPPHRRGRPAARARGDLQGARRGARAGRPATETEGLTWTRPRFERRTPLRRSRERPTRRRSRRTDSCSSRANSDSRPAQPKSSGTGIKAQTEQTIDNLEAILAEAGSGLDRIVKTTVFLASLDDFQGMNSVYAERVGDTPPARSTIEVAGLPSGALVEIEAVALL